MKGQNELPGNAPGGEQQRQSLSKEDVFDILSNERRRYILQYLQEHTDEQLQFADMVNTIAAWENDKSVAAVEYSDRKSVYTALRQTHLPKLDDTGVIDYDRQRGELTPSDGMTEVQPYLNYSPENEVSWGRNYLGLSVLAAILCTMVVIIAYTFEYLSLLSVGGVVVVAAFVVSAIVHQHRTHRDETDDRQNQEMQVSPISSPLRKWVLSDASKQSLKRETVFEILRNERRRYVVEYLNAHKGALITDEELIEYVAAQENDTTIAEISAVQRKRTATGLTQIHLPMLREHGVIEYDPRSGEVELMDRARAVELYLEYVPEDRAPWSYYFLGLSLIAITVLSANVFDVSPIGDLSVTALLSVVILVYLLSSAVYFREMNRNRLETELGEK